MKEKMAYNSTYQKGGVVFQRQSCGKTNISFQIKFCSKSSAFRVAAIY
jgi:hypothetical protein